LQPIYPCITNIYGNFQSYRCIEIIILSLSSQGNEVTLGCGIQLGAAHSSILNIHAMTAEGCPSVSELVVGTKRIVSKYNKGLLHIVCRAHAVPLPCRALINTCHAASLPCSDSAVSFVNVRMVAGNIRTASPQCNRSSFL
jgi:hypothetical protein